MFGAEYLTHVCVLLCCMGVRLGAPIAPDMQHLQHADRAMVRWICSVKLSETVPTMELYAWAGGDFLCRWY